MTGVVFDIKKAAIHDGPGLRTTVFLKGCPLRCAWCHNPESIRFEPEIKYVAVKCLACGECVAACPHGCHAVRDGRHLFDRARCVRCGRCVDVCPGCALEVSGEERTVEEVMAVVLKDRAYFENSGGGLTVSGGEPLSQPEFTRALLAAAKAAGLHTCLDTCGCVPYERFEPILEAVDLFLYDIKETDPERHRRCTGQDNARALANLRRLDAHGAQSILRCPVVPGFNDREDHFAALGALAESLAHVEEIDVLPFHPYGNHKREQIGAVCALSHFKAADADMAAAWRAAIAAHTGVPVK